MRTRAWNYGSFTSSWRLKPKIYDDVKDGSQERKVILLDPERYPLYIGNKIYRKSRYDVSKQRSSKATKVRWLSALTSVLCYASSAPFVPMVSEYLTNRLSAESASNSSTQFPRQYPCEMYASDLGVDFFHEEVSSLLDNFNTALCVPAILSSLLLSSYGDVIGRRPVLLIALVGSIIKLLLFVQVIRFHLDVKVLYAAFGLDGLAGSSFLVSCVLNSMGADIHREKNNRALWFAFLVGLNFLTNSIVTFLVIQYISPALGTMGTTCLLFVPLLGAILIAVSLLPESLSNPKQTGLSPWKRLSRVGKIYTSEGTRARQGALFVALLILSLLEVNVLGPECIDPRYLTNEPICWDYSRTLIYTTARLAGQSVAAVLMLKLVYRCACVEDGKVAVVCTLLQGGSFVLESMATYTWAVIMVPILGFPGFVSVPIVENTMSFLVSRHDQGALFAGIAAKKALSHVTAYASLGRVYTETVHVTRGAIYLILASIAVLSFLLFFPFFYLYNKVTKEEVSTEKQFLSTSPRAGKTQNLESHG